MKPLPRDIPGLLKTHPGRRVLAVTAAGSLLPVILCTARVYRRLVIPRTRVVAVVGSYGKSTTTRALATVLCGGVHRWTENNTFLFVALAVLRTRRSAPFAVVEVAIDGRDQMALHARTVRPDVAVVTSIGTEHHRSLGSIENTRAEKARMVEALPATGFAVVNGDDPNVLWMRDRCRGRTVTYGLDPSNDVRALDVRLDWPRGTRFILEMGAERRSVTTPLVGDPGVRSVLATVATATALGQPVDDVISALAALAPTEGRLQPVLLDDGLELLRDDSKSSLETVETALDVLGRIPERRRLCVLGEVSEPPGSQGPLYREIGARVAGIVAEAVFVGGNFQRYAAGARRAGMSSEKLHDAGRSFHRAVEILRGIARPADVVLIKGRDTQRLERIALALEGRGVGCRLEHCDLRVTRCRGCRMLERGWE